MKKQSKHKNQNKKKTTAVKATKPRAKEAELEQVKENGNKKKAVIIIVSVLAVIVCVAAAVLLVKYFRGDFSNDPTEPVTYSESEQKEGETFSYVEYEGARMPVEFAEFLRQAAIDSQAACESQGVALTIGKTRISKPEFRMYYHDEVCAQYQKAADTELETGLNRSGIDVNIDPAEQKHLQDDYTWETYFINNAVTTITNCESIFDMAKKDGFELSEAEIAAVLDYCDLYKPEEEDMVSFYEENFGTGATYSMYCAKYIRSYYTQAYSTYKATELEDSVTDAELNKEYTENRRDYLVMGCRVYPIEGEYEKGEVTVISTEAQFVDFASKNFASVYGEGYDVDARTENRFISYRTLNDVYAPEVAQWMFDPERKPGDIAVIDTLLYDYLCYVKTLPFDTFTSDIYICEMTYQNTASKELVESEQKTISMAFDEWKAGEATLDSLKAKADEYGFVHDDFTAMANDELGTKITRWVYDSSRKAGDCDVFYNEEAAYIIYFKSHNKDDLEWKHHARSYLATVKYEEMYQENTEDNFGNEKRDDKIIKQVCREALPNCKAYSDRYRESLGLTTVKAE